MRGRPDVHGLLALGRRGGRELRAPHGPAAAHGARRRGRRGATGLVGPHFQCRRKKSGHNGGGGYTLLRFNAADGDISLVHVDADSVVDAAAAEADFTLSATGACPAAFVPIDDVGRCALAAAALGLQARPDEVDPTTLNVPATIEPTRLRSPSGPAAATCRAARTSRSKAGCPRARALLAKTGGVGDGRRSARRPAERGRGRARAWRSSRGAHGEAPMSGEARALCEVSPDLNRDATVMPEQFYRVRVVAEGPTVRAFVNNELVAAAHRPRARASGSRRCCRRCPWPRRGAVGFASYKARLSAVSARLTSPRGRTSCRPWRASSRRRATWTLYVDGEAVQTHAAATTAGMGAHGASTRPRPRPCRSRSRATGTRSGSRWSTSWARDGSCTADGFARRRTRRRGRGGGTSGRAASRTS